MGVVAIACNSLIVKRGRFLLVEETKSYVRGMFNLPGGGLEFGETCVACAKREAYEETGLRISVKKLIGLYEVLKSHRGNTVLCIVFYATVRGGRLHTTTEHPSLRWCTDAEIKHLQKQRKLRTDFILPSVERYQQQQLVPLSLIKRSFV